MAGVIESTCKDCGETFFFTRTAQVYDTARGLSPPERCPACRRTNAAGVRAVGAAYWNAPIETDDGKRCWGTFGLGRLARHRSPPKLFEYTGIPTNLPLRPLADAKTDEERKIIQRFATIAPAARDLVCALEKADGPRVCILVGPTGTGKSTWVPYCLLQSKVGQTGRICVTQPRTITLKRESTDLKDDSTIPGFIAKRLLKAPDRGAGQEIGLLYRNESSQWDHYTRLLFATDGIIIRWLTSGYIANFSVLMIDEAHEQSENMEQIFALLRYKMPLYPRLRVVIASATIAALQFQEFFGRGNSSLVPVFAPSKAASQTNYPVYDRWPNDLPGEPGYAGLLAEYQFDVPARARDCPQAAAMLVRAIRTVPGFTRLDAPFGDILVFMPTLALVDRTVEAIRDLHIPSLRVLPCHAQWSENEAKVFYRTEAAVKKAFADGRDPDSQRVIVATTYAETSVTISNLRYVIDSGYATSPQWSANTQSYGVNPNERHTRAGCIQRRGRVGRQQAGECFYLYSKTAFDNPDIFLQNPRPAVARSSLDRFLLTAKACGIDDLSTYEWMGKSATPQDEIMRAQAVLRDCGAIDLHGDITPVGVELERIEADSVALSTFMSESDTHACALEVAAFIAFVGCRKSLFHRDEAGLLGFHKWRRDCHDDLEFYLRLLHHWRQFGDSRQQKDWCCENGLSHSALLSVAAGLERNLRQFSERTHERLIDRALDIQHLHRTRLVLAMCMPDSAYLRDLNSVHVFRPHRRSQSEQRVQIDQESACAGNPAVDAFICVQRRHDDRALHLVARHIVRILPMWLDMLPTAGPLARGRLIREEGTARRSEFAEEVAERILKTPVPQSLSAAFQGYGEAARELEGIREGWSNGGPVVLAIDRETGCPVLLKTAVRLKQTLVPGSLIRGQITTVDTKRFAAYGSQGAIWESYLREAGREVEGIVVDVKTSAYSDEPESVTIELEPGVAGVLYPENAEYSLWQGMNVAAIGERLTVTVLADQQAAREGTSRFRLQTAGFAKGVQTAIGEQITTLGTIHSSIYKKSANMPTARTGVRVEVAPGHLYRMMFDTMPEEWASRNADIGKSLEVVIVDSRARRVYPKSLLDQAISLFTTGTQGTAQIANVIPTAAFVTLGAFLSGIIPRSEISWSWVDDARDAVKVGETVPFVVIDVDHERYSVCLSIKQTQPHPWDVLPQSYRAGEVVEGKVASIREFGAFVEVLPGIQGLMHISELSWKRVSNPAEVVSVGDTVRCKVISVDRRARRMALSRKALQPDPWLEFTQGTEVSGVVRDIRDYGVIVEVGDGISGLVHIGEMAHRYVDHPRELVAQGDSVQVRILSIDTNRRRMQLSMKQANMASHVARVTPGSTSGPRLHRSHTRTEQRIRQGTTEQRPSPSSNQQESVLERFVKWLARL